MVGNIKANDPIFLDMYNEYCTPKPFELSRLKTDFITEIKTRDEYQGREIYELIQNADDQDATVLRFSLNTEQNSLTIVNNGDKPFSEEGYCSIMLPDSSPKVFEKLIGQKGLGFRAILNWADSVDIVSNGVRCSFSPEVAAENWRKIQNALDQSVIDKLNKLAKKKGKECPVPILAIPKVTEEETKEDIAAEISIRYKDGAKRSIQEQLKKLSPRILLFLRKLKRIEISMDGEMKCLNRGETTNTGRFAHTSIGEDGIMEEWTSILKEGRLYEDDEDSNYQVSVAYKRGGVGDNFLYSFFPTKIQNPYNCIIHATFELNQSRKEILDNDTNHKLFGIVADTMVDLAMHLAEESHTIDWEPFSIVSPGRWEEPIAAIQERILNRIESLRIYPSVSGEYICLNEADYISAKMSQIIQKVRSMKPDVNLFSHHLLEVPDRISFDRTSCDDFIRQLNILSENIDDIDLRTELIFELSNNQVCLSTIKNSGDFPHLLIDDDNDIIQDKGYFNTGDRIPNIPDFIDFHYVNNDLAEKIKSRFNTHNVRYICDSSALKDLLDIGYCDKNTVIAKILPTTAADMDTVRQRIKCLFEYFQLTGDVVSSTQADKVKLPNVSNEIHSAEELVLWEKSYPDGVERLDIQIDDKWKLAGAEFWELEIDDWTQFEKFWTGIGVSIFTPKERKCISSDNDYLTANDINEGDISCYRHLSADPANIVRVPVKDYLGELSLEEVLCLLASDLDTRDTIVRREEHKYYYNKKVFSNWFKNSYCSFYLRREIESIKGLEGYVISADMSPNGITLDYDIFKRHRLTVREIHTMISHLGAVEEAEDLSKEQLYQILLAQPEKNPEGTRIAKIYNAVKKALITKSDSGENLSIPRNLMLFARKPGDAKGRYYPRNQVYYWDNDSFPKQFLKDKPKLEIGHRVGEDQVKTSYGIRLPKDNTLGILEEQSERNSYFEERLHQYIQDRVKFILAFRAEDLNNGTSLTSARNALEKMTIHCYKSCKVASNDGANPVEIGDYEMVVTKDDKKKTAFSIRYSNTDVESSFRIPEFCAAITEAIAITLKLKTENTEFIDAVTTILVGDESMNEYYVKRKLGEDADSIINRFGEKKKETEKTSNRYNELQQIRERYVNNYTAYVHEKVKNSVETQMTFKSQVVKFRIEDGWLDILAKKITPQEDLATAFDDALQANFGVSLLDLDKYDEHKIEQCKEYSGMLDGLFHISDEDISLLYFPGNGKLISEFKTKYLPKEPSEGHDAPLEDDSTVYYDNLAPEMCQALWTAIPQERNYSTSSVELSQRANRRRSISQKRAKKIGDDATDIVIKAMMGRPDLYGTVRRVDESGNILTGTDSLHYDVEYVDMLTNKKRRLEVKSIEGNECHLTPMEYKTGKDNPDEYDIAFVRGGKPYLFKKPFADKRFRECIWPTDFTINLVNLQLNEG